MNILFSSDDNYAQHLGVVLYSLLMNNAWAEKICIYVIDNEIDYINRTKLESIVAKFRNSKLIFIPFKKWKDSLSINMIWSISLSAYGRLFVGNMLPSDIDRVLYLDCDMLILTSLESLWNMDMGESVIAAVQDSVNDNVKTAVSLHPNDSYFNSGMLLIDLNRWRQEKIEKKCLSFLIEKEGMIVHHDQGVLNCVLCNKWCRLSPEFNLMTLFYFFNRKQILKYYGEHSEFYSENDIEKAKKNPVILHFTPSFTSRPWMRGCKHPLCYLYWDALLKTPWSGTRPEKDNSKWYQKLINWRYRNISF